MTPEQFCYWLQGFVELMDCTAPNQHQWQAMCDHLNTVFYKVTPKITVTPGDNKKDMSRTVPQVDPTKPWPFDQTTIPTWPGKTDIIC